MGLKTIAATAAQLATIPIVASITASAKHVVNAEHVLLLTFELGEKLRISKLVQRVINSLQDK